MKLINKGTEPKVFANWKKDNPESNYDSFSKTPVYREVREALLKEQGYYTQGFNAPHNARRQT